MKLFCRTFNCEVFLKDTFKYNWEILEKRETNPLANSDFKDLPLRTKVEILQCLCDYRLDATDIMDQLKVSFYLFIFQFVALNALCFLKKVIIIYFALKCCHWCVMLLEKCVNCMKMIAGF